MKTLRIAACAALLATAAPAFAQTPIEDLFNAAGSSCFASQKNKTNPPLDDLAVCQTALAKMDAVYAGLAAPTPHDANLHHMYRAFVQTAIGGAYGQIDGVRSARLCTQTEATWADVSKLVNADSSPDFAPTFDLMRKSIIAPLTKCRAEKGTPAGAAPLP